MRWLPNHVRWPPNSTHRAVRCFTDNNLTADPHPDDAFIRQGTVSLKLADVEAAQKEIVVIAQRLAEEGTINLGGKGAAEFV